MTWQNIHDIKFETVLSPAEIPRITCIDVFGTKTLLKRLVCNTFISEDYIAVGSEDGRVRIYDQYWKPLVITRHQAEKVNKVTFFYGGRLSEKI